MAILDSFRFMKISTRLLGSLYLALSVVVASGAIAGCEDAEDDPIDGGVGGGNGGGATDGGGGNDGGGGSDGGGGTGGSITPSECDFESSFGTDLNGQLDCGDATAAPGGTVTCTQSVSGDAVDLCVQLFDQAGIDGELAGGGCSAFSDGVASVDIEILGGATAGVYSAVTEVIVSTADPEQIVFLGFGDTSDTSIVIEFEDDLPLAAPAERGDCLAKVTVTE